MPTPMISNVIRNGNNKYALDFIPKSQNAAVYSTRRLRSSYTGYPLRIRDDTGIEQDIPFCGENLCTGTMLNWLQRDLVASIPLGVDGNADGISDGWSGNTGTGITATRQCVDGKQQITITNSTTTNSADVRKAIGTNIHVIYNVSTITISGYVYVSGNVRARLDLNWRDSGDTFISVYNSTSITSTQRQFFSFTTTVPNTSTIALMQPLCSVIPNNIGNTGTAYFDTVTVTISNQSAYISKWYDQSGNNNHAVQTTTANQPRIVNAGVVETDNGKPTLDFDGTDDCFRINDNSTLSLTTALSLNAIYNNSSATALGYVLSRNDNASTNIQYGLITRANPNCGIYLNGLPRVDITIVNSINISTFTWNQNNVLGYNNGKLEGTNTYSTPLTNKVNTFIGCRSNASDGSTQIWFFKGKISEIILFNITLTNAQRTKLEKNQGKYYGIAI